MLLGFRVLLLGFRVLLLGFRVLLSGVQVPSPRVARRALARGKHAVNGQLAAADAAAGGRLLLLHDG